MMPINISTEIYLIRHGKTQCAAKGQYIGSTDVPLSAHGMQQARLLAERLQTLQVDACYCSMLTRCRETASLLAAPHRLPVVPVAALREIDYGRWEGLTLDEIAAQHPTVYAAWRNDPATVRPPGGESGVEVLRRVRPAMEQIASAHPGQRVLVIAHRTVNRLWLCDVLGYPLASYRQAVGQDFTAVNILAYAPPPTAHLSGTHSRFSVIVLNDTSHLQ
ncbi:alpha-ribazole phosphatase [candidate division KSB3 bacterium]|uniref:Alpha-ribazole phosphatase n=1 Tax=candidate division KSB3 bacterium TaxID=2044937 RepID=A0A9D5Q6U9_9BACT|nr:alpha-ribazole phosphatase [candidate division KSB3 bacterium]MBD3325602.1 alpha-ribazole phosphatase [candidate division KSB3 bacterium]